MDRTLSAPGKLFLSGEYAVLWGGVARILAVGPRVHALVRPRPDRQVDVVLADGRLSGPATPAGVRWEKEVPEAFRFVATTIDLSLRLLGTEGPGFSVAFESSPTVDGLKLGLGSSARAVVLAAEAARYGLEAHYDTLKLSLLAHADAQGGKGSGGDVAAAFAGGVVRYRKYDAAKLLSAASRGGLLVAMEQSPSVDLARMGEPVFPMLFAFSGHSASTTALVKEVERKFDEPTRRRFVERSDGLGETLETGLLRRDFKAVELASEGLQSLLWELGVTRDEGLDRVLNLARTFGCAGKQSGAGGGDGAVLFAPDAEAQRTLLDALLARGIHAFAIQPDRGLQGEVARHPVLSAWLDAL
ncbi:MAG: phosphomevalonate kinase [Archangium sp.]|nr:phosphomevalonate kinase [Archangium sp.]